MRPRLALGLGCDRGTPEATLRQAVDEALAQIGAASATRFDPSVVLACIGAADSFAAIAGEYADDAASIHCELQRLEASLGESIELTLPR